MPEKIEYRHFNDPIHGMIKFPKYGLICKLINTPEFQRLRRIKQLGFADYVYPGATHTRFAHSIGVAYLVEKAVKQLFESRTLDENNLKEDFPGYDNKDQVILAMTVAGLLHDIGHAPFSHALQYIIPDRKKHEHIAVDLINNEEGYIGRAIREAMNCNILPQKVKNDTFDVRNDIGFVIKGEYPISSMDNSDMNNLAPLSSLVNGQLDCDRIDYLLRDTYFCGIPSRIDYNYIFSCIDYLPVKAIGEKRKVIYKKKAFEAIIEFLFIRYLHYKRIADHKNIIASEQMLKLSIPESGNYSRHKYLHRLDDIELQNELGTHNLYYQKKTIYMLLRKRRLFKPIRITNNNADLHKILRSIDDYKYIIYEPEGDRARQYYKIRADITEKVYQNLIKHHDGGDTYQMVQDDDVIDQLNKDILIEYSKDDIKPVYLCPEKKQYNMLFSIEDKTCKWVFAHPDYSREMEEVLSNAGVT